MCYRKILVTIVGSEIEVTEAPSCSNSPGVSAAVKHVKILLNTHGRNGQNAELLHHIMLSFITSRNCTSE